MSLPFKPSTVASRRDRETAEAVPAKGPSPAVRIALFLGVFYLFVWPALALYLLTLAVSGVCLLPGVTGCEAFLALDSVLPAWAARSLGGLLLLALALSFLVPASRGSWRRAALWSFRSVCGLAPAVIGVADMSVPVPFPVAWLVGLFQPGSLALSLRLWAASLLLVGVVLAGWLLLGRLRRSERRPARGRS